MSKWIKPALTLVVMIFLVWILPSAPMDPWNLLSPKKIATMLFALTLIQVMGVVLIHNLGSKSGTILIGFLGGLVSSTATTASLAQKSKTSTQDDPSSEILTFLAATGAMLLEGVALIFTGATTVHFSLLLIFLGPLVATTIMTWIRSQKLSEKKSDLEIAQLRLSLS
jgi:uncharacterized membrane protein (DUF4010 family)